MTTNLQYNPQQYYVSLKKLEGYYHLTVRLPDIFLCVNTSDKSTISSHLEFIATEASKQNMDIPPEISELGFKLK